MVAAARTRRDIEMEICEGEKEFLFLQKYNRLADARIVRLALIELESELEEVTEHESAERCCYE